MLERRAVRRAGVGLHDARAHVVRVEAALLDEVVDDDLVGLDDPGEAARLDRHVGQRGALVERHARATPSPANSSTLPMPWPVLKNGWRRMWSITSFARDARRGAAPSRTKRAVCGHGDPDVPREPGVGHVGRAHAEREAAERARHARVAVGADDELPGERDLLDDLVVADGLRADELPVAVDLAVELDALPLGERLLHGGELARLLVEAHARCAPSA